MKISGELFDKLSDLIAGKDCEEYRQAYREGRYPRSENTRDVDVRYRWDLFYAVRGYEIVEGQDLSSDHIDTALRRIVAPL